MNCSMMELMEKAVIDVASGEKIGNLCDVEIDTKSACVSALIVSVKMKGNALFGKFDRIKIDWGHIRIIGKDAVLVECCGELKHCVPEKSFLDKIWN
ncbi:MAG: YlmC/YmxH family sporulation protein [Clostridia bacterium]|nr:YlmC/YmxH family sporulation protein [Clostridia bacterium]